MDKLNYFIREVIFYVIIITDYKHLTTITDPDHQVSHDILSRVPSTFRTTPL